MANLLRDSDAYGCCDSALVTRKPDATSGDFCDVISRRSTAVHALDAPILNQRYLRLSLVDRSFGGEP